MFVPLFALSLALMPAVAAALTYPDVAPCDTTLQACITGAVSGDTIEIATNDRIDENPIVIDKSLILRPAAGFTPLIGNPDPTSPNIIRVRDAGVDGGSVSVLFEDLNFDAGRIFVEFDQDVGHRFEMTGSRVVHNIDSNNEAGVDLGLVRTTSTIVLTNNFIANPGQPVSHFTGGAGGDIEITLQGNLLTSTNIDNSQHGILIIVGGDENLVLNLFDNVVYQVAGCNCGSNSGMYFLSRDTANLVVNVTNNTFDGFPTGPAIDVRDTEGTSTIELNLFNNTVSNADGEGFLVSGTAAGLTVNNGFNNFFNTLPNVGIVEGQGTIFVDPLFIDAAGGNYRLQATSPLIDAGTLTPPNGLPAVDADGLPRVAGDSVDIGAYETLLADLEVVKTVSSASADLGDTLTYTIDVANIGQVAATGVQVSDLLPAGFSLQEASASQGSCSGTTEIVCELGDLDIDATATVSLRVSAEQAGTWTNTATVLSEILDSNPDNDSSSVTTVVSEATGGLISGGGCGLSGHARVPASLWTLFGLGILSLGLGQLRHKVSCRIR
ncbi:MAG TPA: DUF11 domain-containing protein [bacterium]|nr:DUF11 domain-containing protein [bacterium]